MRSLNDEHVDFIREDIRRRGVFTESLQENLLDHLCCFIEEQPEDERPFEKVYQQALEAFGHNGLALVQEETLFLINNKYLVTMKKLMYITGALASTLLVAAAFFKFHHWPGANVMLLCGIVIMALLFAPSLFYLRYKESGEKKARTISLLAMGCAFVMLAGALFKILHWPYAHPILFSGFGLFFAVFLPLYMINGFRNPATRFSTLGNGLLLASTSGLLILLTFQGPSHNVDQAQHAIVDNEVQLLVQLEKSWMVNVKEEKPLNAMSAFQQSCAQADNRISLAAGEVQDALGHGPVLDPETVASIDADLKVAVNALNMAMSGTEGWKNIPAPELKQAFAGDLHFQVMQLRGLAFSQGLSM